MFPSGHSHAPIVKYIIVTGGLKTLFFPSPRTSHSLSRLALRRGCRGDSYCTIGNIAGGRGVQ